jgi:hypothetical protein
MRVPRRVAAGPMTSPRRMPMISSQKLTRHWVSPLQRTVQIFFTPSGLFGYVIPTKL